MTLSSISGFSFLSNDIRYSQARVNMSQLFDNANLSEEASEYAERIQALFDDSEYARIDFYNETVDKLEIIQNEIESEQNMLNESEKQSLIISCELLSVNLNDLLTMSEQLFEESDSAGRCRWLCRAWRKVRSVVVGVVVGTVVGITQGSGVIGGIIGGVSFAADAFINDRCYGAFQCGSWTQHCVTGACLY